MIIRVSTWKFAAQRGMLLGVLQRGSQQVAGILVLLLLLASLASWPACLAGISMSESPPKARTRFIYSILLFFCTGCSQKLFLTNCAAFCCTNCCLPSQSLSPSLSLLALLWQMRHSLVSLQLSASWEKPPAAQSTQCSNAERKILWGFPNWPTS